MLFSVINDLFILLFCQKKNPKFFLKQLIYNTIALIQMTKTTHPVIFGAFKLDKLKQLN